MLHVGYGCDGKGNEGTWEAQCESEAAYKGSGDLFYCAKHYKEMQAELPEELEGAVRIAKGTLTCKYCRNGD